MLLDDNFLYNAKTPKRQNLKQQTSFVTGSTSATDRILVLSAPHNEESGADAPFSSERQRCYV